MLNRNNLLHVLKKRILYADGALGTVLQQFGLKNGCPDELNLKNPYLIQSIHKAYLDAGANILLSNTFGASRLKLKQYKLEDKLKQINQAAVQLAKEVLRKEAAYDCLIAADISELGEYIEPLGKLTFDEAYELYKEQLEALEEADIIFIETISDIKTLKAAIIAAKEIGKGKPIITSMTFEDSLRTSSGTDVKTYVKIADALGADIIGANCSSGPEGFYEIAKLITQNTNKPVILKPNAGMPQLKDGKTIFDCNVKEFAEYTKKFVELGVNIVGGCCGTDPGFISAIVKATEGMTPIKRKNKQITCFCSRTRTVELGDKTLVVGERINPSGRKQFREEIKLGGTTLIRNEALKQQSEGASLLDINVGVPGTDEIANLKKAISVVQNIVDLPLVIDTSSKEALEEALKQSDGKPLINSVNGDEKSLDVVLPLAKKYGGGIIALCLDKGGIPKDVEGRVRIAKKIIAAAENIGIPKEDIIIDCLTLTIATNPENEKIILQAVKEINQLGYKTVLGVSNISYGLPNRDEINQKFFTKASQAGLNLAILNPLDNILREDTEINKQSLGLETIDVDYENLSIEEQLYSAILYGDNDNILEFIDKALKTKRALEINELLLSAMEEVGRRFKAKKFFLPQVLLSAEAMKSAFERLKNELFKQKRDLGDKDSANKIIFATVENDIHDIGKNIVIAVLESYGFNIVDLGRDVPLDKILTTAAAENADLIALSALMTTTAPEMEKIVKELNERKIKIPVIIGGAVITEDYAKVIGAAYSQDALAAVKVIKKVISSKM